MVSAEHTIIANATGRVRSIRLVQTARSCATRIGEPIKPVGPSSVRFVKRELLDTGGVVWTFHIRSQNLFHCMGFGKFAR
jgi:hypothetical protein